MKFMFIKNYLTVSSLKKREFFKYVSSFSKFKFVNQKMILSENALLLQFAPNCDVELGLKNIRYFFKDNSDIEVEIVNKILKSEKELILEFDNGKSKIIKL